MLYFVIGNVCLLYSEVNILQIIVYYFIIFYGTYLYAASDNKILLLLYLINQRVKSITLYVIITVNSYLHSETIK